MITSYYSSRN